MGKALAVDRSFCSNLPTINEQPCLAVKPQHPAVVIFTSGSTGKPKGIVLEHVEVCTSSLAHGTLQGLGPGSRVLQFAAYTFDVSLQDIYTNLMLGGTLCVPSDEARMNNLAGVINDMNINYACLTTTVACLLKPAQVPTLKTLTLAGEAVTREALETWADNAELHNAYGPAECSVCTWKGFLKCADDPANIGRGLASHTWVVDPNDHNRLVPVGCSGELLIEGPLLARGCKSEQI